MFETLTDRLTGVIKSISNKGHLTEKDIDATLKEVRRALLEADVNFKVARSFVASIKEQVMGEEILSSITAGQHVVKITNDELIKTLGGDSVELTKKEKHNTVLMVGLNGSGKTTTAKRLPAWLMSIPRLPPILTTMAWSTCFRGIPANFIATRAR